MSAVFEWMRAHPAVVGGVLTAIFLWGLADIVHLLLRWAFEPSFRRRK